MRQDFSELLFRVSRTGGRGGLWILATIGLLAGCTPQAGPVAPPGPVPVTVAEPIQRLVQDYEEFTGRLAAKNSVDVHSRVTGYLDENHFKDGAEVKAGDLLLVIDRRPFQAAYDSAAAQITLNKANRAYREAELKRNTELIKTAAVSRSELDQSAAAFEQAKAAVTSAEANAEGAKLNLDFTEIRAAIAGRISSANIDKGNLVVADQTLLTTIVSVDPMYVKFDVDERRLLRIQQEVREGKIKVENGRSKIPWKWDWTTNRAFRIRATIDFTDNQIDESTGTIQVRGRASQPAAAARPARAGARHVRPGARAGGRTAPGAVGRRAGPRQRPGAEIRLRRRRQEGGAVPAGQDGPARRRAARDRRRA